VRLGQQGERPGRCPRHLDLRLDPSQQNQQAALGPACVIAVRMNLSSSFSSTISPDTACDIDHRREIQMFDRCPDRDGRIGRGLFLA
jgi:hypothetical protein